jgi:hypothetical protein
MTLSYVRAHYFAYFGRYSELMLKKEYITNDFDSLTYCICRGCLFNLNFAISLYKDYDEKIFHSRILQSICESFIMNNIICEELLSNTVPTILYEPNVPSRSTCLRLLELNKCNEQVLVISIIQNWVDIYEKCGISASSFHSSLIITLKRYNFYKFVDDNHVITNVFRQFKFLRRSRFRLIEGLLSTEEFDKEAKFFNRTISSFEYKFIFYMLNFKD